jgi:hypothetical protein
MATRRSSAIRKKAGVKKRITAKQKAARVKNIAIARSHRKRSSRAGVAKTKVDSKGRVNRTYTKKHVAKVKSAMKKVAGQAFKKKYETLRKINKGMGLNKEWARREGHAAAIKASKTAGKSIARKYAMGIARRKYKMTKSGAKQFSAGYVNSILRDLSRGR